MVLEIDETSRLETTEDSISSFLALPRRPIQELGEVDEL
jgi:hypothetical protein